MGGQLVTRHAGGEDHVIGDPEAVRQTPKGRLVRAPTDDDQRSTVHALPDRRQRPDQHVLALARHKSRHAHHDGAVAEPVAGAQFRARNLVGCEPLGVHPRRQVLKRCARPERRRKPVPGVPADICHRVCPGPDAAQRRPGQRQHRPTHLVAVRARDHAVGARVAGKRRHQRQRCGRTEPHGVGLEALDQSPHPHRDRRLGQHQRARMPHHLIRCGPVVLLGALPPGRVHRQRVGAPSDQVAHEVAQI